MVQLDYRDARPIYTQIADGYRTQILSGILREGDRLPSVRELASQLTINPNTIQRAYRELEAQGWIATVPGKGCFVCAVPQSHGSDPAGLLAEFDELTEKLISRGISRETLMERLRKGGTKHA